MLQKLRDQTKNTAFKVLVGIIVFVLAIFGFGAFNLFLTTDPEIASVNGEGITQNMLAVQADRERRRLAGQLGEQFDPDLIDPVALQGRALEQLISTSLLRQAADDLQLGASSEQVDKVVIANPNFQVDGRFEQAQYLQVVQFLGYTPQAFLDQVEETFALSQLNEAISTTGILTDWEVRQGARLLEQRRDLAYLTFSAGEFNDEVVVADEDVQLRYEENELDYMTEQSADVKYVELSRGDLIAAAELDDEEVRNAYEADRLASPPTEERRSAHILLRINEERSAEQAKTILAELKDRVADGALFAELAEEFSEDPGSASSGGDLGSVGKGVFDPEFERVLFSLAEGEISDPVQSEFGYHLIRLDAIDMNTYPDLEVVRPEIEMRLKQEKARELFLERVRELDNLAFEHPDTLDEIVAALELELKTADGIVRGNGEGVFSHQMVRDAVFSDDVLNNGYNSAAIEYEDQRAVVVRVTDQHDAFLIAFEDVAEEIKSEIVAERARVLAVESQAAAIARLRAGESVSVVADDYGLAWLTVSLASRRQGNIPFEVVQSAFALERPAEGDKSIGEADLRDGSKAIVTVTRVQDGDLSTMAESEIQSVRDQLARRSSQLDFGALYATLEQDASIDRPQ